MIGHGGGDGRAAKAAVAQVARDAGGFVPCGAVGDVGNAT